MGVVENPLFWGAVGSGVGAVGDFAQRRGEGRRARRLEGAAMDQIQEGPGFLESILRQQFNVGQDGTMQFLRSIPGGQGLTEMAETGAPFDTSELFESLAPLRQRQLQRGLGDLRATAPGLGQRFGSAMRRGEEQMLLEHLQGIAAQDSATQMQAHESAQGRRLQATQLGGLLNTSLMQLLGQQEQGRRGMNLQALQTAGSIAQPQRMNFGQPALDFGQLMILNQLMGGDAQPTSSPPQDFNMFEFLARRGLG